MDNFDAWLAAQGKAVGVQTFDNKPQGFAEDFFDKGDIHLTADVLKQGLWWWTQATEAGSSMIFCGEGKAEDPAQALTLFIEYHQQSAFYYELRARHKERYKWDFGKPWIFCSREQREYLTSLWPTETTPSIWQPSQQGKAGWVQIPGRQINLKANDTLLTQKFLGEVERLRKQHGIERPLPGHGVRRKPISFLPIELLDQKYYLGLKPDGSQRSQVSKELRAYLAACKDVGIEP